MNLVFCFDHKDLGLFVCCLKSLVLHGGYDHYDVYILETFMGKSMKEALCTDFGETVTFHFIHDEDHLLPVIPKSGHHSKKELYRMALPFLIPTEVDRALYLDVNTVVINSMKGLYEMSFDCCDYIGCTHTFHRAANYDHVSAPAIDPNVLLMNIPALRQFVTIEKINNYVQTSPRLLPEKNIVTALWGNNVKFADTLRYNLSDHVLHVYNLKHRHAQIDVPWARENTSVINYCDGNKPWNPGYSGVLGVFYQELLERGWDRFSDTEHCKCPEEQE